MLSALASEPRTSLMIDLEIQEPRAWPPERRPADLAFLLAELMMVN